MSTHDNPRLPAQTRIASSAERPGLGFDLVIEGMSCASCAGRVERALTQVPGVLRAQVNLATERAHVEAAQSVVLASLIETVQGVGYQASAVPLQPSAVSETRISDSERRASELARLSRDLRITTLLALPVFGLEMGSHVIPSFHNWIMDNIGMQTSWWLQLGLTLALLLGPGRRFYVQGIPALLRAQPNMNSLVAVGTLSAFAYSVVATAAPDLLPAGTVHVYFEAAVVIVNLVLAGHFLEARAKGRTSEAIQRLIRLQPARAEVLRNGHFIELPTAEVQPGDTLRIRPGERIAVDGVVLEGETYVDESMLTGEPLPVVKRAASKLSTGTVNQQGSITFKATAVGSDTVLAQIVRMVEQAQTSKLPIQAFVDQVTLWFVPAVMGTSLFTFGVWLVWGPQPALALAVVNAVSVLIIACPCAMGLATPMSILVGTGRGAELGLLFRHSEALQQLKAVRVVALDKTGTLTLGHPTLTDLIRLPVAPTSGHGAAALLSDDRLVQLMASVEARSEHPIAGAVVAAALLRGLELRPVADFLATPGRGVRATVDGIQIEIGAARWFTDRSTPLTDADAHIQRLASAGKTSLVVAVNGHIEAVVAVSDPIKQEAAAAVQALHRLGLRVVMVTGDNQRTAHSVAEALGIDEVVADVLPAGKLAAVSALRAKYGALAFVGDGINDAPALAEAEVGIAMGVGTDIAIEAADVVLMRNDLLAVPQAVALSRATIRNIHQNLFWAFAYNTALIPLAAGALYPWTGTLLSPMLAALGMALSSVFVLFNALRLRGFRPPMRTS